MKKTQVATLTAMMLRGWVSTADAFGAGITSFHRRLEDFREKYQVRRWDSSAQTWEYPHKCRIDGKIYLLTAKWQTVETRWGKSRIKLYRLAGVK
jgi:hypothetical protein